jgi:hypothetical protein
MRSKVSVNKGKGKAPAPKRKIQESRPQQETSNEDEIEAEPNENIQDEDEEPTQRANSKLAFSKTTQQMEEKNSVPKSKNKLLFSFISSKPPS